ncbi:MAG TPA: ABC transporter transmembrane domain-containing protein [Alphaproteobacteria bacterium]|nr:ABC transporter transmembrane domain-containing protein [Alphaproteobacteria bacterium]
MPRLWHLLAGSPRPWPGLPRNVFRYVLRTSAAHQLLLSLLSVAAFLFELVPLELQRRIVNDLVKHHAYSLVVLLCVVYGGMVFAQGATKLAVNLYRSWIGERATRDLRRRVRALEQEEAPPVDEAAASGIQVAMIVSEVEPIGGFVGESISEPLLHGGILLSTFAYMIHLSAWMALATFALVLPQAVFIPFLQRLINRRTKLRVRLLRNVSASVIATGDEEHGGSKDPRIDRVFALNMGVYRLKFTMNFLTNFCNHLQIVAALLIGGLLVSKGQFEIGGVVAFISAITRLKDPWDELVDYFRNTTLTQVKFRLVADAVNAFARGGRPARSR